MQVGIKKGFRRLGVVENLLMPNNAFGLHCTTAYRFNNQVNQKELFEKPTKYYANILTPYSRLVNRKIEEILSMNLTIDMMAPRRGGIRHKGPLKIVKYTGMDDAE